MKTALLLLTVSLAGAQTQPTPGSIEASGSATITAQPDMASINVGVITQAATAQDAADQNAAAADAMIKALQAVLGNNGTIQTVFYSLDARFNTPPNQPPVLIGYTANNTVQVKTTNISLVGKLIDTATAAHSNSISGPAFGLQNPEPQKLQALAAAAAQAMTHAAAIAKGIGATTGRVITAQEGATVTPLLMSTAGGAASGTPIQNGTVTVSATVTVMVALIPGQ